MIGRLLTILITSILLTVPARAADEESSKFRAFTDKRGQKVEARIVSISDDLQYLQLEQRNGQGFELAITVLSLDDQQFLREWLYPSTASKATGAGGTIRVFGVLPNAMPIDTDALAGIDDITSIHAMKQGWFVLRKSGEVITFQDKFPGLTDVAQVSVYTVWVSLTYRNGTVGSAQRGLQYPDQITEAVQCVANGRYCAVLLRDGSVKVFGKGNGDSGPVDPPAPLTEVVALAACQGRFAALHADGRVSSWSIEEGEMHEAMMGDGVVEIEGSIFFFLARTRSGEVYQWSAAGPAKAIIPQPLESQGPFLKIRCNGATRAAQKEDGSWIAWGTNGAGIVDHINELGPVPDLVFFSEPGKKEHGYVIWREP